MFVCAITANILYGGGILTRTYIWADIASSAPWLLGSLGTVFLDLVIFSQASPIPPQVHRKCEDCGMPSAMSAVS